MNKANVLVPDNLDLVDEPESTEIVSELLFGDGLVKTAKVDVPACIALADGQGDLTGDGAGLSPANLEFLAMENELFDGGIGVECGRCGTIEERDKDA